MLFGPQVRFHAALLLVWDFCGGIAYHVVLGLH
jgi:hypothetical protein